MTNQEKLIQVFHPEFDEYLDMDEITELRDKDKVKVTLLTAPERQDIQGPLHISQSPSMGPSCTAPDPKFYTLPELRQSLRDAVKGVRTPSLHRRIIDWLFHDLCRYTV